MSEEKRIDQLEEDIKKTKIRKNIIIVILIIIILLLLFLTCLLGYKMGKIGYQPTSAIPQYEIGNLIEVRDEDLNINKDANLHIFKNPKFNGEEKIAPQSYGKYQFVIENIANTDISYHIKFADKMDHFINMKYKLKIDNIYIRGNTDTYVSIEDLSVQDINVLKGSNNIYTLEWYWEDNDKLDTIVGSLKNDEYYTLNLEIQTQKFEK